MSLTLRGGDSGLDPLSSQGLSWPWAAAVCQPSWTTFVKSGLAVVGASRLSLWSASDVTEVPLWAKLELFRGEGPPGCYEL